MHFLGQPNTNLVKNDSSLGFPGGIFPQFQEGPIRLDPFRNSETDGRSDATGKNEREQQQRDREEERRRRDRKRKREESNRKKREAARRKREQAEQRRRERKRREEAARRRRQQEQEQERKRREEAARQRQEQEEQEQEFTTTNTNVDRTDTGINNLQTASVSPGLLVGGGILAAGLIGFIFTKTKNNN